MASQCCQCCDRDFLRLLNVIYMNLISLYNIIGSGDESMLLDIYLFENFSSQFICQMVEESCYIIYGVPGEVDGLSVGFRGTNIIIRWVS